MRKAGFAAAAISLLLCIVLPIVHGTPVGAVPIAGETFTGISTTANQWVSGGGANPACLTAATTSAPNSIPACSGGPLDTVGNGALRLTPATASQSGFAFYNVPVSAADGLKIEFDMYQYHSSSGTGADGISFFLIDGSANPTMPGALGGSLGYSSSDGGESPGLVGGYVGVGFDRYGNFSDSNFGTGGPGRFPNSITVRGSEGTGYEYVTKKTAAGALGVEAATTRTSAKRHVVVTISTNNIMNIGVNYFDGSGLRSELSGLNLNTINGDGSLPENFKFGFAASTGGSNNVHEIGGLVVNQLPPKVAVTLDSAGTFVEDEIGGQVLVHVANDAGAQPTLGTISTTITMPSGVTARSASGDGWNCTVTAGEVTCTRPGDGVNALDPGDSAPDITIEIGVGQVNGTKQVAATVSTDSNDENAADSATKNLTITASADDDGIRNSVEAGAPNSGDANNDGTPDKNQPEVTSLPNTKTNTYTVLESAGPGCSGNQDVSITTDHTTGDGKYTYPAGMIAFKLLCDPGDTATITIYYYGLTGDQLVLRKYRAATASYILVPNATFSQVTINGQLATRVVYQITDGGALDDDGVANGTIVDPAGPAVLGATTTVGAPNTGLPPVDMTWIYGATVLGLALIGAEARRARLAAKAAR